MVSSLSVNQIVDRLVSGQQFTVEEIIGLLNDGLELTEGKKAAVKDRNTLYEAAGQAIQDQVRHSINQIETNLPKYWSSRVEESLFGFIDKCQSNWTILRPCFPDAPSDAVDWLRRATEALVEELKLQRAEVELGELMDEIASVEEYWPTRKAEKAFETAVLLGREEETHKRLRELEMEGASRAIELADDLPTLERVPRSFPLLANKGCPLELTHQYEERVVVVRQEGVAQKCNQLLEQIENAVEGSVVWPKDLDKALLDSVAELAGKDYRAEVLKRLYHLFNTYQTMSSKGVDRVGSYLPELGRSGTTPVEFGREGSFGLYALHKGDWLPSYRWEDEKIFPNLTLHQEGEWKSRRFKCEWWDVRGVMPVGTILKLVAKKDRSFLVVTDDPQYDPQGVRQVELDEHALSRIIKETQMSDQSSKAVKPEILPNIFFPLFRDATSVKIMIRVHNLDKAGESLLGQVFSSVFGGSTRLPKIVKRQVHLVLLLSAGAETKYLQYIQKRGSSLSKLLEPMLGGNLTPPPTDSCGLCRKSIADPKYECKECQMSVCPTCLVLLNKTQPILCPGSLRSSDQHLFAN